MSTGSLYVATCNATHGLRSDLGRWSGGSRRDSTSTISNPYETESASAAISTNSSSVEAATMPKLSPCAYVWYAAYARYVNDASTIAANSWAPVQLQRR